MRVRTGILLLILLLSVLPVNGLKADDFKVTTILIPSKDFYQEGETVQVKVTIYPDPPSVLAKRKTPITFITDLENAQWVGSINLEIGGSRPIESSESFLSDEIGYTNDGISSIEFTLTGKVPAVASFTKNITLVKFVIDSQEDLLDPIIVKAVNPGLFDSKISNLDDDIANAEIVIDGAKDYGADVTKAEEVIKEAKDLREEAVNAKKAGDYDIASQKIEEAENKVSEATTEAEKAMAKYAIDKADESIQSATTALLEAEREGASITTLKFLLDDIKSKVDDAQEQYDAGNYNKAKELAEKAISGSDTIKAEAIKLRDDIIKKKQEEEKKKEEEQKRLQEEAAKQRKLMLLIGGVGIGVIVVVIVLILVLIQRGGGGRGRWDELR